MYHTLDTQKSMKPLFGHPVSKYWLRPLGGGGGGGGPTNPLSLVTHLAPPRHLCTNIELIMFSCLSHKMHFQLSGLLHLVSAIRLYWPPTSLIPKHSIQSIRVNAISPQPHRPFPIMGVDGRRLGIIAEEKQNPHRLSEVNKQTWLIDLNQDGWFLRFFLLGSSDLRWIKTRYFFPLGPRWT